LTEVNRAGVEKDAFHPERPHKVSMVLLDANAGVRDYLTDMVGMGKGDVKKMQTTLVVPDRAILRRVAAKHFTYA
jgi:hypothetical protein